jgi:ParB-like chromosome segregation protein Spo0J
MEETATETIIRPTSAIIPGERRRDDMGDLSGLAKSLERYGLLHPIVIDDQDTLIAGGRRLEAAKQLGWQEIDCRLYGSLTDTERREIELEENLQRKDLTAYERSKTLVTLAETAAEADRETHSEIERVSGSRGPTKEPGSLSRVAERTGKAPSQISEARQHVVAVEHYPQLIDQPQSTALDFAAAVKDQPELATQPVADVVEITRAKRHQAREERKRQEAAFEQSLDAAGVRDPKRADVKLLTAWRTAMVQGRNILALKPEGFFHVFEDGDWMVLQSFIKDWRTWCDHTEVVMKERTQSGLRVVGGGR